MTAARMYAEGLSVGFEYAAEDRREGRSFASEDENLRAQVCEAHEDANRAWRAFRLGVARGYRDATRSRTFVRDADGEAISERWGI